ncbi:RNA methyltransferase [Methanogenium sp. MK-MG]|uniref:RNA methyltransferase n=1 Tax=Methanogenium sp. MK-MG TaxID=2599926 RepID=UPI0013EB7F11|nr:RNA methyltransferase [Methanogenium sp. MK-MG]KAF1078273.1 tRNA (cytidine-2'-O-)-methyltransferase TrmJ [Methanogenium sp. MK-MG]
MPEVEIVLVEPLYEGNIGFAARVMKNFGFTRLVLINPPDVGIEALSRASHAKDVLESAVIAESLDDVIAESNMLVATTGELSKTISHAMRMPYYAPGELRDIVAPVDGRISILFGRENWGLSNEEVRQCDVICTIPTSPEYPIVNISHAVGIICYELAHLPRGDYITASRREMDALYDHIDEFLDLVDHHEYKRANTLTMMRRIFGRSLLTGREVSTFHGLIRRAEWHINVGKSGESDDSATGGSEAGPGRP